MEQLPNTANSYGTITKQLWNNYQTVMEHAVREHKIHKIIIKKANRKSANAFKCLKMPTCDLQGLEIEGSVRCKPDEL